MKSTYSLAHICFFTLSGSSIPSASVSSVDQLWHDLETTFVLVADRHTPVIQRRVRGRDNCPWLNKEIKSVMRQRDYFHSKAKKTNLSEDWASYRCYRNRASNAIKRAKAVYSRRLLDNSGNEHKAFWRTTKKILLGESKDASSNISIGGTLTSDKNLIADSFNKFFTSSVTRLLESVRSCCVSGGNPSHQFLLVATLISSLQLYLRPM